MIGYKPQRGGALDTAKKLRTFLDFLKDFCVANRKAFARRYDIFDDVGCADIPGLMQFLDLLAATYVRSETRFLLILFLGLRMETSDYGSDAKLSVLTAIWERRYKPLTQQTYVNYLESCKLRFACC